MRFLMGLTFCLIVSSNSQSDEVVQGGFVISPCSACAKTAPDPLNFKNIPATLTPAQALIESEHDKNPWMNKEKADPKVMSDIKETKSDCKLNKKGVKCKVFDGVKVNVGPKNISVDGSLQFEGL